MNNKKFVLKGGEIVDPLIGRVKGIDIEIEDRFIKRIKKDISTKGESVVDCKGLTIFPGFIDLHTHLREPGYEYKEDIETGAMSALYGGFTTILAMPNTSPPVDNDGMVEYIIERSRSVGLSKVYPVGCISKNRAGKELAEIGMMTKAGAVAFSDDGDWVQSSSLMRRALEYSKLLSKPVITHCEEQNLSEGGLMNEGAVSYRLGLKGIPSSAEEIAVFRDIALANMTGAKLHIAHISTKGSIEILRDAKKRGNNITAEVTPHHLLLTEEELFNFDTNYKVNPPLRTKEDSRAVLKALEKGIIDCIATDHAPHASFEKEMEFQSAPFGIIGLQFSFPLLYTRLVLKGKLDLDILVKSLTLNPSRILGFNNIGILKEGYLADIAVFNLNEKFKLTKEYIKSKSKNTPFLNETFQARPVYTIVEGKLHRLL